MCTLYRALQLKIVAGALHAIPFTKDATIATAAVAAAKSTMHKQNDCLFIRLPVIGKPCK